MEERRVLATIAWGSPISNPYDDATPRELGELVMDLHRADVGEFHSTHFDSDHAAEQALEALLSEYWSELFGSVPSTSSIPFQPIMFQHASPFDLQANVESSELMVTNHVLDHTNVREAGIDEADVAELLVNDLLIAVQDGVANLIDVRDPESIKSTATIALEGWNHRFLSYGDRLFILSDYFDEPSGHSAVYQSNNWTKTSIRTFDLSDPSSPNALSRINVDGQVSTARIADGQLILGVLQAIEYPRLQVVTPEGGGPARFETEEEYFARLSGGLVDAVLPDFVQLDADGDTVISQRSLGDFEDLQILITDSPLKQTSLFSFDITGDEPVFVDGESLLGVSEAFAYVDQDSYYSVQDEQPVSVVGGFVFDVIGEEEESTTIFALSFDRTEVAFEAYGNVPGNIQSTHALDESGGVLRVFTTTGQDMMRWTGSSLSNVDREANLYLLQTESQSLSIVGQLNDIADGERQLGSVFDGDLAYVTTGKVELATQIAFVDPLHIIDLSNPQRPLELSELDIPGLVLNLRRVGDSHLVGVGWGVGDDGQIQRQVTLYDVSNSTAPTIIQNWTGDSIGAQRVHFESSNLTEMNVRFDSETGLLIVDPNAWSGGSTEVFQIDLTSETPIRFLGAPTRASTQDGFTPPIRTFVLDEHLVQVGLSHVSTFELENLAIETSQLHLAADSNSVVESNDLQLPHFSDASVVLAIQVRDEDGNEISNLEVGETFWVTITADRLGDVDNGIYAAYFDIDLDTDMFEVLETEVLDPFTNGVQGEVTDQGIRFIGGFSDEQSGMPGPNEVVRFQLKVIGSGTTAIGASASDSPQVANEFLVYGENDLLDPANIDSASLQIQIAASNGENADSGDSGLVISQQVSSDTDLTMDTDVNQDGVTSAVDVLILINELNYRAGVGQAMQSISGDGELTVESELSDEVEFAFERLDVNRDNDLSPVDVLVVINYLNGTSEIEQLSDGEALSVDFSNDALVSSALEVNARRLKR